MKFKFCSAWLFMPSLVAVLFYGCGQDGPVEITEMRQIPVEDRAGPPAVGTAARLGLEREAAADTTPPPMIAAESHPEPASFHWPEPAGWRRGPDRPMRLATYLPEQAQATECVVAVLAGPAGGVTANLNRWRTQIGADPLTDDAVAALPRWEIMGVEAIFMECVGQPPGETSAGAEAYVLFGVICPLPDQTLFVRMNGPEREMAAERERFEAFCRSIHTKELAPE